MMASVKKVAKKMMSNDSQGVDEEDGTSREGSKAVAPDMDGDLL
jgi:hypothetical protein